MNNNADDNKLENEEILGHEKEMQHNQSLLDKHLANDGSASLNVAERHEWLTKRDSLTKGYEDSRESWMGAVKQSGPHAIDGAQERIVERQHALLQRNGKGDLTLDDVREDFESFDLSHNDQSWKPGMTASESKASRQVEELGDFQSSITNYRDGQGKKNNQGRPTNDPRGFEWSDSKAAEVHADRDGDMARLADVQHSLRQGLGRNATHDEVVAEEQKRASAEQQQAASKPSSIMECTTEQQVSEFALNGGNIHETDEYGRTALHRSNNAELSVSLINAGMDVNAKTKDERTALHTATDRDTVNVLVNSGARVDAQDRHGNTALHSATSTDKVEALLEHGADTTLQNNQLRTPAEHHTAKNRPELAQTIDVHDQQQREEQQQHQKGPKQTM